MAHSVKVNGTNYSIKGGNTLVNGTGYKVSGGGVLINGTRQNIAFGTPLNNLSVGSSVYMNVGGVRTEFLIVHKGNPDSSVYDSSCDGIWLCAKVCLPDPYRWHHTSYAELYYGDSNLHVYLNSTVLSKFDSSIQNIIKQVKIPYQVGSGAAQTLANGLSTKLFILNYRELGFYKDDGEGGFFVGAKLSYFDLSSFDSEKRYAPDIGVFQVKDEYGDYNTVLDGTYWIRSADTSGMYFYTYYIYSNSSYKGLLGSAYSSNDRYRCIRPALILPYNITVDDNMNIIA